ncbi:DUF6221 family protein [Streptomyces californicus]|uniref:DUF6221 family protein n=1 Tax=Streptomyces californicus TaxID=67351 RepID=UPI000A6C5060|nr:DUF6221 family protein [Streptomyces californicus]QRV56632.1 hypothetical protein I6J40_22355 [Streptomyces californicus]
MDDLVQFLRDRLDEDEQAARAAHAPNWSTDGRTGLHYGVEDGWMTDALTTADADHIARHDPARVLREVEAKRRLLTDYEENAADLDAQHAPDMDYVGRADGLETALQHLATAYADHPDYRDAWRP